MMLKRTAEFGVVSLFLLWAFFYAMSKAVNVPTFHLDGAFQTASGLFRLDAGQFPGKDFFPYLGIGPLFSLYPAFKALGANLCASVCSAQWMTLIFGALSASVISHFVFRPKSFLRSLANGTVFFAIPIVTMIDLSSFLLINFLSFLPADLLYFLIYVWGFVINPGNSLRPIRGAIPYLIAIAYYLFILDLRSVVLKYVLSGVMTGFILLWSNDFSIPTAGLFGVLIVVNAYLKNELQLKNFLLYICSAFLACLILLIVITQGHPIVFLKYNFLDVAKDQWWFFGPYGHATRVFDLQEIFKLISKENIFPLKVLVLTGLCSIYTKRIEHVLIAWIGLVLFFGGVLASMGGHFDGYFRLFFFWGVLTLWIAFFNLVFLIIKKALSYCTQQIRLDFMMCFLRAVICVFSLMVVINAWNIFEYNLSKAKNDPNRFYVSELGGYLGTQWKDYINLARQQSKKPVIEEYWGLWSATLKVFPAWSVDSVIHALGYTRNVAKEKLESAALIISTRHSVSPDWQSWNVSQNFWFYDELLRNWSPVTKSPTTIVWKKNKNPRFYEDIACSITNNQRFLSLNIKRPGFYRVEMSYDFVEKGRHLLMFRNNLSFASDAWGYVSLDPSAGKAIFPVSMRQTKEGILWPILDSKVLGNAQYDFKITACRASQISFSDKEVLHVP